MIECEFSDCVHNSGELTCDIEPTLRLYNDGYSMLFVCTEMDIQQKPDLTEQSS